MQSLHASKCRFHMLPPQQRVALVIPHHAKAPTRPDNTTTYMTTNYTTSTQDTFPVLVATTNVCMLDTDVCRPLWTTVWTSYDIADMMGVPLVVLTNQYCETDTHDVVYEAHMYRNRRTSRFTSLASLLDRRRNRSII